MGDFSELIRHFDKIRGYVRDFYVYGFKTRDDYRDGSGRTYDNERRRIENWFGPYISSEYQRDKRKAVAITIDSSRISVNPLFAAWKSKSFTSNDIMLHFFLTDLLSDGKYRSADQCTDEIQEKYEVLFDSQTVRKKLAEYEAAGIFRSEKEGRRLLYGMVREEGSIFPGNAGHKASRIGDEEPDNASAAGEDTGFFDMVSFYQGAAPFGFIGSTILDNWARENEVFRFKHDFLVHTLEDEVLYQLLRAMKNRSGVCLEYRSLKAGRTPEAGAAPVRKIDGTPLKIFCSTQTGRRYVCIHQPKTRRFSCCRLDSILRVEEKGEDKDYELHVADLEKNTGNCWGVSFGEKRGLETVTLDVALNEETESHILMRLEREGRGGTVKRVSPGIYRYEKTCFDCNEMLPWVKTFIGRIVSFSCTNSALTDKFYGDMDRMARLYGEVPEHGS